MDTWRSDVQTKILLKSLDATRNFILEDLDGDFLFITNDEATVCARPWRAVRNPLDPRVRRCHGSVKKLRSTTSPSTSTRWICKRRHRRMSDALCPPLVRYWHSNRWDNSQPYPPHCARSTTTHRSCVCVCARARAETLAIRTVNLM